MLRETFLFLSGIGEQSEQKLWKQGIDSWAGFVSHPVKGISPRRKIIYDLTLRKCIAALENKDASYFAGLLQSREHWRVFDEFKEKPLYLDIETSGYYGYVTVVGLYDGEETRSFVAGGSLTKECLQEAIDDASSIITFNGSSFDLPVLMRAFGVKVSVPHIDLRGVCQRIGLTGGLKAIEKQVGLARPEAVDGMTGEDAPYLWRASRLGDEEAMEKLLLYNKMDIVNLKPLAELAVKALWQKVRYEAKST